ncbi:MAG: hypothetical protein Q9157_007975 [Trypethelium eluteriae]
MHSVFYERARKYLQNDEMRGHGEGIISVGSCQACVLVAAYEFKNILAFELLTCLPQIMTNLPSTEEAFEKSKPQRSISLEQALTPNGASSLSPFSGVIVLSCLFGRNLLHLHRPTPDDNEDDLNGEFWKRHRSMEQILLNTSLAMPDHLRLPAGIGDPNIIFLNMNIHTSAICLHQAAIFKADRNKLPTNVSAESKVRCITAAAEIASIMRMISHMDLSAVSFVSAM